MGVACKKGGVVMQKFRRYAPSDTSCPRFARPRSKNPPSLNPGSAPDTTIIIVVIMVAQGTRCYIHAHDSHMSIE